CPFLLGFAIGKLIVRNIRPLGRNYLLAALRLRVAAAFLAEAERSAADRAAEAAPPFLPPVFAGVLFSALPRSEPLCFPLPDILFTVAQARASASSSDTQRSSQLSSMCSAWRFCLSEYADLSPRGMVFSCNFLV